MTDPMGNEDADERPDGGDSADAEPGHPARELSVHLLRMFETRLEAAGIAVRAETQLFTSRLKLTLVMYAGLFFAVWAGIALLAIALPEHLRVPVLGAVVVAFIVVALVAWRFAKKKRASDEIGTMRWFLGSLRADFDLLCRAIARQGTPTANRDGSPPHDLAA